MPIYEFRCQSCGYEFERLQKLSEPDPKRCPECGAEAVSRLISAVGFRLKGGGWYETDFKRSNRRNVAGGEAGTDGTKKEAGQSGGEGKSNEAPSKDGKKEGKKDGKKEAGSVKSGGEAAA